MDEVPLCHPRALSDESARWYRGPATRAVAEAAKAVSDDSARYVKRFRGGLVFKARRLVYHSTLGLRVMKKTNKNEGRDRNHVRPLGEVLPSSSLLLSSPELSDTKVYEP